MAGHTSLGMSELIEMPKLALDRHNRHFATHPDAVAWRPECMTWGKPHAVTIDGQPVLVELNASFAEFEEAVGYRPGLYRLIQVTADGRDVPGTVAYAEIHGRNLGSDTQQYGMERALGLCDRMAQASEHKDRMMADMVKTLMHTHVQLQAGAVNLLEAANTTIRVANGIERIERDDPVVDVEFISEQVIEAMDERGPPPSPGGPPPWILQLLNGPLGQAAVSFLQGFAQSAARAQANKNHGSNE